METDKKSTNKQGMPCLLATSPLLTDETLHLPPSAVDYLPKLRLWSPCADVGGEGEVH
jgi:hypothetical protein